MITRVCLSWLKLEENKKWTVKYIFKLNYKIIRDRTVMFTV